LGGLLPDILEPALSSWHRDVAHSLTTGAGVVAVLKSIFEGCEAACRENAEKCKAIVMAPLPMQNNVFVPAAVDPIGQLFFKIAEILWRFLAGFLNGLATGYVSHLALDACTPRSIPLLSSCL
jgi:membrane-bound metal-dependent hydrolase YbcI (DUF457 family)